MNRRKKLFFENFFIYGIGNVLTKIIPIILLPVITKLLPDPSSYGIFDIFLVFISLLSQLAIMGFYDALFREYFDYNSRGARRILIATASKTVLLSSVFIGILIIVFRSAFSVLFFGNEEFQRIFIFAGFTVIFFANRSILLAPIRINNKRRTFITVSFIESLLYYVVAVILLTIGYSYYSLIFGKLISVTIISFLLLFLNWKYYFNGLFSKKALVELFKIGIPLLPTFLFYWIFNSIDRVMVLKIIGANQVGVYAVGSRVASVSQFVYMAYAGGLQFFSFSTMKDRDQVEMTSTIFNNILALTMIITLGLFPFRFLLFDLLFSGDYLLGSEVFIYLFTSPLLLMLFQTIANQFMIIKKSYLVTLSLSLGVIVNIVLNYSLIPVFGAKGAAFATLMGYVVSLSFGIIFASIKKLFEIKISILICTLLYVSFFILTLIFQLKFESYLILLVISFLLFPLIKEMFENMLYRKSIK